jgi:RimJ/RimL family protein N-acetyltransferase
VKLIPISERLDAAQILWDLLAERPKEASISHKKMPTLAEHLAFIAHHDPMAKTAMSLGPFAVYQDWCFIEEAVGIVGAIYLTNRNEIGVAIFKECQGRGFARDAIALLMMKHGERNYYANVAPENVASQRLWEKLGFKLIQHTYALEAE